MFFKSQSILARHAVEFDHFQTDEITINFKNVYFKQNSQRVLQRKSRTRDNNNAKQYKPGVISYTHTHPELKTNVKEAARIQLTHSWDCN